MKQKQCEYDKALYTFSQGKQELEKSDLKDQKLKQILINLKLDDPSMAFKSKIDIIQNYTKLNAKLAQEIEVMKLNIALIYLVESKNSGTTTVTTKIDHPNETILENIIQSKSNHEISDTCPEDLKKNQSESCKSKENADSDPFSNSIHQIKARQLQEFIRIRQYRNAMCQKWFVELYN